MDTKNFGLYTFLALIELICERPRKTPTNKKNDDIWMIYGLFHVNAVSW